MTGAEVLRMALSLMTEEQDSAQDYEVQAVDFINLMMPELSVINNSIRKAKGLEPLEEIPAITHLDDTLTLEEVLARGCLPFGLAAKLVLDDDTVKASYFNGEFMEKKRLFSRTKAQPIRDVYADSGE